MPHYKCARCKTRLRVSGTPAELVGDLCPGCGSLLEPVTDLADLVGFRSIERFDDSAGAVRAPGHQRISDRVDEFVTRLGERRERDLLKVERWFGDDDPIAAPAALAPEPYR